MFDSFQNMMNVAYGHTFRSVIQKMSCMMTITQVTNEMQIPEMIDVIYELHVPQIYLVILIDTLNTTMVTKRTINFNVMIYHRGEGGPNCYIILPKAIHNQFFLADGSWALTSLCPTLGKMYAQEHIGVCPLHLQEPFKKTLRISYIGGPPFITNNPIGGSDFILTNLLAKKYHFLPKYIPARSWDKVEKNNRTFGMVHWVSFCRMWDYVWTCNCNISGFNKTK